jgi:hypothetical protein
MTTTYFEILIAISVLLSILVTLRSIYFRRRLVHYREKLGATLLSLEKANEEIARLHLIEQKFSTFKADLSQAELATKMQHSRMECNRQNNALRPPERYNYIHSMAQKGMTAADIATVLTISNHEADQLLALASLSQK